MSTELPDVVLKEGADWTNITFKGKGFAWVDPCGEPGDDQGPPRGARRPAGDLTGGV